MIWILLQIKVIFKDLLFLEDWQCIGQRLFTLWHRR